VKTVVFKSVLEALGGIADAQRVIIDIRSQGGRDPRLGRGGAFTLATNDGYVLTVRPASGRGEWKIELEHKRRSAVDTGIVGQVREYLEAKAHFGGHQFHGDGRMHEFFFSGELSD
jgi:hypothetical protein